MSKPVETRSFCACGCGEELPPRYILNHDKRKRSYTVCPDSGCWVWDAVPSGSGYGVLNDNGRKRQAHRWMYELHVGPIPDGLYIDHLCRNRRCVNPDHLEPVTPAVNTQRSCRTKLTPDDVRRIRSSDLSGAELARQLGVAENTVQQIRQGTKWRNVCESA